MSNLLSPSILNNNIFGQENIPSNYGNALEAQQVEQRYGIKPSSIGNDLFIPSRSSDIVANNITSFNIKSIGESKLLKINNDIKFDNYMADMNLVNSKALTNSSYYADVKAAKKEVI
ncbi:MAG: hypothetical protein MK033_11975 [Candidatus Caenarcaniphilales bacterium]|nr:hypothetical protein [Candidatus Caenarcaniphilales bacterium]